MERSSRRRLMTSNFAKRLDRLERLIRERTQPDTSPLYFREGHSIPEKIALERVIFIKRALIDPPEREEEQLPEMQVEPEFERKPPRNFDRPLPVQNLGLSDLGSEVFRGKIWLSSGIYSSR
jgi:hypothetical protein